MDIQELHHELGQTIHAARDVLEQAEKEKRSLTAEDDKRYETLVSKASDIRAKIERSQKVADLENYHTDLDTPNPRVSDDDPIPGQPQPESRDVVIQGERRSMTVDCKSVLGRANSEDYRQATWEYLRTGRISDEMRALQADSDTAGGYLLQPAYQMSIIEAVDNATYFRGMADVQTVPNADSLGRPSRDADVADHDWTVELGTGTADTSLAFGKRELTPHPLAKRIKVSRKLLRSVGMVENYVRGRLAYKLAVTQEKAFLTGSGAGQPLGVFTASDDGISTSRDISSGNTSTEIQVDGLKSAYYNLKMQYRSAARWMFHRDAMQQISKLKDGNGNYLLTMSNNTPGVLDVLGLPTSESEYVPNTFTTGQYVGIIGDYRNYMIVDALTMEMQRLEELYAETNEVGFIVRSETDGMPVLEEAFVRVTLG